MTEDQSPLEQGVAAAFSGDMAKESNETRFEHVMQRIRAEVASRDVLLFAFVRIWLTALEFGAAMIASRPRGKQA